MPRALLLALAAPIVTGAFALEWQSQSSGVTVRLRGLSAVSESVAWTSGAAGTVLRTADGGNTWTPRPVPDAGKLDFRDVDAIGESVAYALSIGPGEASRIYKTTDGGASWILQFANTDPKIFLDAMAFMDKDRGVAFGDSVDGRFVILTTSNGGGAWVRVADAGLPPALPNEGAFAASGTNVAVQGRDRIWIGTSAGRVLRSADGGRTWAIASTPIKTGESAGIFSIAFRDALHGIVVGGDYRKEADAVDNAAVTSDGGVTWTLAKGLSGFRSVVAWVPGAPQTAVAAGPTGADWSTDGGRSWTMVNGPGFDTLGFAKGTRTAWAAGASGHISKLTIKD